MRRRRVEEKADADSFHAAVCADTRHVSLISRRCLRRHPQLAPETRSQASLDEHEARRRLMQCSLIDLAT